MDLDLAKGICIISLFFSTLLFGSGPYFIVAKGDSNPRHVKIREMVISYLKCFGGGVFMSACLIDLLPEGIRSMDKYLDEAGKDMKFPLFLVITSCGFFIIAFVELLAHSLIYKSGSHDQSVERNCGDQSSGEHFSAKAEDVAVNNCVEMKEVYKRQYSEIKLMEENKCQVAENGASKQEDDHGHDEVGDIITVISGNPLRAFLLLAALSFHTVFDGLAVGLKESISGVWQMFSAIVIHKSLVSICLGLQLFLVYKDRPLKAFLWTVFFSLIAPIGIGIGMALTSGEFDELAKLLTSTILQGLATGTFLYVTFFEILREELVDNRGAIRLVLVIVGFSSMTLLNYFSH